MNRIHELIGSSKNDVITSDTHPIPFLIKVDEIKQDNKKLSDRIATFRSMTNEMALSVTNVGGPNTQETELDTLTDEIRKMMSATKDKLTLLKKMPRENMSANIHSVLCSQLIKSMTEFQSIQTAHKNRMQTRLIGKLRYLHPDLSNDEILQMIEN